jgi:hypothetical protein
MKEDFMLRRCNGVEAFWKGKAGEMKFSSLKGDKLLINAHLVGPPSSRYLVRCTIEWCTESGRFACFCLHKLTKLTREILNRLIRGAGRSLKEEAGLHRPYSTLVSGVH